MGHNRLVSEPRGSASPTRHGHGLDGVDWPIELASSPPRGRRVYADDCGHLIKVQVPDADPTRHLRNNDVVGEARMLRLAGGVPGVPAVSFVTQGDGWQALGTGYVRQARTALQTESLRTRARTSLGLAVICWRLSRRGIVHHDIKLGNVLLDPAGKVWLVDFDQATPGHGFLSALVLNFVGSHFAKDEVIVHGSFRTFVRSLSRRRTLASQRRMPRRPGDEAPQAQRMWDAWQLGKESDANAPGDGVAYYALDFEGLRLPGERPWADRWTVLRGATDFEGKRVLELGCNMGLLSSYLQKYAGAAEVWGVDHDHRIIESARRVSEVLGVSPRFSVADLDDSAQIDQLKAYHADVVTCLNVWNWVNRHELLAELLASAPVVLFEGHDAEEEEVRRLRDLGFQRVSVVSTSERGRPVILATKQPVA